MLAPPFKASDFPTWTEYHWHLQYRLAEEYLLPCLEDWGLWEDEPRILDVGCGEGGGSCALALGGGRVTGIDTDSRRIELARSQAEARSLRITFSAADPTDPQSLRGLRGPYDIVLLRDELQRIANRDEALAAAAERVDRAGALVVTFSPYWSAFGGYQQTLVGDAPLARLPFTHWLPREAFRSLTKGIDGSEWDELATIRAARLTLQGLSRLAGKHGLYVARSQNYLLRPAFRLRHGWPVLGAGPLGHVPLLRELLVTGSYVLLRSRA